MSCMLVSWSWLYWYWCSCSQACPGCRMRCAVLVIAIGIVSVIVRMLVTGRLMCVVVVVRVAV
eukprot:15478305-Alexandrium_andersonii.AAC.1